MAIVYKSPYEQFQTLAEQELALLRHERERLVQRMAEIDERERQFSEYLKAVAPLIEQDSGPAHAEAGLTNLCRQIMDRASRWVTAQEVRTTLQGMGMDISSYTNPMAVLHSILHRVAACHRDADGKLYYGRRDLVRPPGSQVVRFKSLPREEQRDGRKNAKSHRKPHEETRLRPPGAMGNSIGPDAGAGKT
jgi:hypothetical protein